MDSLSGLEPGVDTDADTVIDRQRGWTIHRCGHGCVHLTIERLMLTLSADEFGALLTLMRHAAVRFDQPTAAAHAVTRAH